MFEKKIVLITLLVFFSFSILSAERINLKNGDMIEGIILSMDSQMVRVEDSNEVILEIKTDMIDSIDYSSQDTIPEGNERPIAQHQNTYQPVQKAQFKEAVSLGPINAQPAVHFESTPFQSGLLDPEFEARRRMVSYNEQKKNPVLATSLSLVFPGTGHFYTREIASGFFFLGTRVIFAGMTWYGFSKQTDLNTEKSSYNDILVGSAGAVGFVTMMIIEAIDSYTSATDYNNNLRLKLGIDTLHKNTVPIFEEQY